MYSMPRDIAHEKSIQAAQKAPELDAMLPEAHSMLGAIRSLGFEWEKAEHEFRKAFELYPKSQEIWINYTWFASYPCDALMKGLRPWKRHW
jgi:Tfp pilus assembly protein PilF